jgi:hypothetical protein
LNPDWDFRVLDANSVARFIPELAKLDMKNRTITPAALSDIVRIMLLHEYGGVWVDATLFCNRALDEWLPAVMKRGFFAFDRPAPDRPVSSWFLAAKVNSFIVSEWMAETLGYWLDRTSADDYFWFHNLFRKLCQENTRFSEIWSAVPKHSADGPHSIQRVGMSRSAAETIDVVDWSTPVFKLTHRVEEATIGPGSLVRHLIGSAPDTAVCKAGRETNGGSAELRESPRFVLKMSSRNLGDHVQVIAGQELLRRFGHEPKLYSERENTSGTPPYSQPHPVVVAGRPKYKTSEWPPDSGRSPISSRFRLNTFQNRALVSDESDAYCKADEQIGCRDICMRDLLADRGIDDESHCPSLTLPRRLDRSERHDAVFVVSNDDRLASMLPAEAVGAFTKVYHYVGDSELEGNIRLARQYLELCRSKAKLIITTMLECALSAIAMGIPVVVFYPQDTETGHASDVERFAPLARLTRIYDLGQMHEVCWSPAPIDVSGIKLRLIDRVTAALEALRSIKSPPIGPVAAASALPPPA